MLSLNNTGKAVSSVDVSPKVIYDEFERLFLYDKAKFSEEMFHVLSQMVGPDKDKDYRFVDYDSGYKSFKNNLTFYVNPDGSIIITIDIVGIPKENPPKTNWGYSGEYTRKNTVKYDNYSDFKYRFRQKMPLKDRQVEKGYNLVMDALLAAESTLINKGVTLPEFYIIKLEYDYVNRVCTCSYSDVEADLYVAQNANSYALVPSKKDMLNTTRKSLSKEDKDEALKALFKTFKVLANNAEAEIGKHLSLPIHYSDSVVYPENYDDFVQTVSIRVNSDGSIEASLFTEAYIKSEDELVHLSDAYKGDIFFEEVKEYPSYNAFMSYFKDFSKKIYKDAVLYILLKLLDIAEKGLLEKGIQLPPTYFVSIKYDVVNKSISVYDGIR